jgi:ribosomal protein S27AE
MSEPRCPNCGQSSAPLLADRWARLLEADQLTLADPHGNAPCPACGHGLDREPRRFGRLSAGQLGVLVLAFLSAILGAGAYAYFSAGPR